MPPRDLPDNARRVLAAAAALPWALPAVLQRVCALTPRALRDSARRLAGAGWVEVARIPAPGRHAPGRLGLTPSGARALGVDWDARGLRTALLTALRRDIAHAALTHWLAAAELVWARGPYHLAAAAVRPERGPRPDGSRRVPGAQPYGPVDLDLVACLRWPGGACTTLVAQVDPGGVHVGALQGALRSLAAWTRRREFLGRARELPLIVLLAATPERAQLLRAAWLAEQRGPAAPLRILIGSRPDTPCLTERGPVPWPLGVPTTPAPPPPPAAGRGEWWAERRVGPGGEAVPLQAGVGRATRRGHGVLAQAARGAGQAWQSVQDLLTTRALGRELLERAGLYLLATADALADVIGVDAGDVHRELGRLARAGLLVREAAPGFGCAPSARGLRLLAALAGLTPERYARARHWPVWTDAQGEVQLRLAGVLRQRAHDRQVLRVLRGLRQLRGDVTLAAWAHGAGVREQLRGGRDLPAGLIPDARFTLRAFEPGRAQWVDTACWLEVDRSTMQGPALRAKLRRYYQLRRDRLGLRGRPERLLIIVPADDEARLQLFRRRLRELDGRHEARLDAWVTRWDLIRRGGVDDLTQPIWRTAHDPVLRCAVRTGRPDGSLV